jgi:limonene-1,2-epoxide hydrolase
MNLTHVQSFTAAMQDKNLEAMLTHMAEDIVLNTPLAAEPVKGKAAVRQVVGALLGVVDSFDFREIMQGPQHISSFFELRVGKLRLDGMDLWRVNEAGLIQEMTVLWRPLPAINEVQKILTRAGDEQPASA